MKSAFVQMVNERYLKIHPGSKENSWVKRYFTELFFFFFTIASAYFMGWNNTDMLWSFWITSLVVGYVIIFRTFTAPLSLLVKYKKISVGIKEFRELPVAKKILAIIFMLIFVRPYLFIVVFLSLHFLLFHLFGAYFLQSSFPHPDIADILVDANGGQSYIMIQIIKTLLMSYWIIVLEKIIFDYRAYRENNENQVTPGQQAGIYKAFSFDGIIQPYIRVVRITVLVVLLLWLNEIKANLYLVYVVIYGMLFFPIPNFRKV